MALRRLVERRRGLVATPDPGTIETQGGKATEAPIRLKTASPVARKVPTRESRSKPP